MQISKVLVLILLLLLIQTTIGKDKKHLPQNHKALSSKHKLMGQSKLGNKGQEKNIEIIKPQVDQKQYKYIELPNKLKVLLISDPKSKMAQVSLDVGVGSWNEPSQFPGLAHLCETMLLTSSQKYPQQQFDKLLASGGGHFGSYTDDTNTNYYMEVPKGKLEEALDMFTNFFIYPLFSLEFITKAINAIESEYESEINNDDNKINNLFSLIADKGHPASKFTIGNKGYLYKEEVLKGEMNDFFKKYYSANLMALALQSSLALSEIEKIVTEGSFYNMKNVNIEPEQFKGKPYQMGQLIKFKSGKKALFINWQLSGRLQHLNSKPLEIIDFFIDSEHKGGLIDYLKSQKLIISQNSYVFSEDKDFTNVIAEYNSDFSDRNDAIKIANIIYNYLTTLKEWLKNKDYMEQIYKEQSQISLLNFQYMKAPWDISDLAHSLNKNKPEEVLSADYIIDKFDPDAIHKYLDELLDLYNLAIIVGDTKFQYNDNDPNKDFLNNNNLNYRSGLYKIDYALQKMSGEIIKKIEQKLQIQFTKPQKNEYIPKNLNIISLCDQGIQFSQIVRGDQLQSLNYGQRLNYFLSAGQNLTQYQDEFCYKQEKEYLKNNHYPVLIRQNTWWKIETRFKTPTVFGAIQIDLSDITLQQFTSIRIFKFYADQLIKQELNQALNSGYRFDLDFQKSIDIKIYGFSEKIKGFFKKVCDCVNPFREGKKVFLQLDDNIEFEQAKHGLLNQIQEVYQLKLFEQALSVNLKQIMLPQTFELNSVKDQVSLITFDMMIQDLQNVLKNTQKSSLLIGNLDIDNAKDISNELNDCVTQQNKEFQKPKEKVLNLKGYNLIYAQNVKYDKGDLNGATVNYYQIGERTAKNYAIMNVLQSAMSNKAYSYLRTDLQLGYVAVMKFRPISCIDGAFVVVQGSQETPQSVDGRIEEFLTLFDHYLQQLEKKEFNELKQSTIVLLRERTKSLTEEGEKIWSYISQGDLQFEERHQALKNIKNLKIKDLQEFYQDVFIQNKAKLSVQLYGDGMVQEHLKTTDDAEFDKFVNDSKFKDQVLLKDAQLQYYECSNDISKILK